jgi:hypothetical protein
LESFSFRIGTGSWQSITSWTRAGGGYTATFPIPANVAFPVSIDIAYEAGWATVSTVGGELPSSFSQGAPMRITLADSNSSFTITLTDEDGSTRYTVHVSSQAASTPDTSSFKTSDAMNILRAVAGITPLTTDQRIRYGIAGEPRTSDAMRILRIVAGLPADGTPQLPNDGWVPSCFTGDTLIAVEDGFVRFDEINVGVLVWAYNYNTGETALKEVLNVLVSASTEIISLETASGEVIKTTAYHPFYVDGNWVRAGNLAAGDKVSTLDGGAITIVDISSERFAEPIAVYNLTVADFHTYFVGSTGILVHNVKG